MDRYVNVYEILDWFILDIYYVTQTCQKTTTPWKIYMVHLQITHLERKNDLKQPSKELYFMLIYRGVVPIVKPLVPWDVQLVKVG